MSLALLFHYLMLNIFWMLIHPSSGSCDLFVEIFHGLYCCVRRVLVLCCGMAVVVHLCLILHTVTTLHVEHLIMK